MTRIIEDDVIDIAPDDWADVVAKDRETIRQELNRKINEFKRSGGHIQKFKPGETATDGSANWAFPVGKAADKSKSLKQAQDAARKRAIEIVRGDQEADHVLVARLTPLLGLALTGKDLSKRVGVSTAIIYRLVATYFPDDPRADLYRKRTVAERADVYEAIMMPRIREAILDGMDVIHAIAKRCGASHRYVSAMNKKHKLNIAKGPGGRPPLPEAAPGTKRKYKPRTKCLNLECSEKVNALSFFCPTCGHITAKGKESEQ